MACARIARGPASASAILKTGTPKPALCMPAFGTIRAGERGCPGWEGRSAGPSAEQVPLFAELPPSGSTSLAQSVRRRTYHRGETIFHKGDPGNGLYIIAAGQVKIVLLGNGRGGDAGGARGVATSSASWRCSTDCRARRPSSRCRTPRSWSAPRRLPELRRAQPRGRRSPCSPRSAAGSATPTR